MQTYIRRMLAACLIGITAAAGGCDKFVAVDNPNSLETDAVDPERDGSLLSQSVYSRFITGTNTASSLEYGYVLGAWFTNHARVGDTFPTRNAVGQRNIPNVTNETDAEWNSIHANIQFARATARSIEPLGNTIDLARAWWVSGFSIMNMAEWFCEGTIAANQDSSRARMSTAALLDSAILDLQKAQTILASLTADTAATAMWNAAQVGIARALLQLGRYPEAVAAANAVPAGFTYNLKHIDNSSQRALGNKIWEFSESRISLVVGPEFRAMADANDPRVKYTNMNRLSQDGVLQFYRQGKHAGWGTFMRFASSLEAQYIAIEAGGDSAATLAFVNTRRAAGNKGALGNTSKAQLLAELMLEKSIDFWLEGHEMRDFRRNPAAYPFVLPSTPAGGPSTYYKPSLGPVGTDTCWPVPRTELERNKNWNG